MASANLLHHIKAIVKDHGDLTRAEANSLLGLYTELEAERDRLKAELAEQGRDYASDVEALMDERDQLRAALRRLEWRRWDSESDSRICPACGGEESVGHDTDCWLAALLPKERHE